MVLGFPTNTHGFFEHPYVILNFDKDEIPQETKHIQSFRWPSRFYETSWVGIIWLFTSDIDLFNNELKYTNHEHNSAIKKERKKKQNRTDTVYFVWGFKVQGRMILKIIIDQLKK